MTKFLNNADIKGYIAQTAVTSYLLKADSTGRLVAAIAGTDYQAPTTALLPSGGTAGQILAKIDGTNYNTQWIDNFAQQIKYDVKLGAALSKGTPVYVSSANGTNIIVSASSNATEATSSKTLGLLETGGALNDIVKVVSDGLLSGLNTSAATIGDPVWLGVNGALIFGLTNKPSAPAHLVYIGAVTRVHATNGEIFIKVQNGFELDELHNVALSSVSDGQGLFYESATSLWKNKTIASVLGYTPANGANYLPLSGGTISGDLTISSTNPRLYFTDTDNNPDYFISNTDGTFTVYDVTNSVGRFKIYSGGNAEFTGAYVSFNSNGYIRGDAAGWLSLQGGTNGTRVRDAGNSTTYFSISESTGAATFSSSIAAGGIVTAPSQFQLSGSSLPTGLNLGVGGNTPLLEFHANFRNSQNTTYRGGELRIDTRDGQSLFSFLSRAAGSTVDNFLLSLSEAGQLKLTTYTSATSYTGTAAGYLAFDSSGNVITVAGVAASVTSGFSITSQGAANNTPSTPSVNAGVYAGVYAFIDLATQNANGGWIDFSKGDGGDFAGRIRYYANPDRFGFHTNGGSEVITFDAGGNIVLSGGSSSVQSTLASGLVSLRFPNQYSSGYTDAGVKLYIFNSGTTIQGFTAGPAYDLQYHSSGSDSGRHAFYVANTEIIRFNKTSVVASGQLSINNGASNALSITTAVADGTTRDGIYLYENSGQASGRQAISWYNGGQSYYKARIWTEVGSSYAATQFGIDVANDARVVATRLYIRNGDVYINNNGYANGNRLVENTGTWSINVTGSSGTATSASRLETGNNQWTWSTGAHTATNPNSITLWDQYSSLGGAGNPVTYGTIVDIYGRSGHEHDQILMDSGGTMYHRNCFYGTNTWNGWRTMIDSSNYNSYSPTLTGGGASGTWGINVTGSSRSLLFSGDSAKAFLDGLWAGGGSYPGYQFTGGNSRFGFSSTGGVVDVYADGNFYATDSSYLVWHAGNMDAPNKSGTSYYQANTWIQFNGGYGIYFPNNYGLHFYPNDGGTYGAARINGTKNGWKGIYFDSGNTLMMNNNESGHYQDGYGWKWRWYNGSMYISTNSYGGGSEYTIWHSGNASRAGNSNLMYYAGFTLDANSMPSNSTGFTYSQNAPYTGPIAKFSEDGYPLQLNATYSGGTSIAYRTRNGDAGSWNNWYAFITSANIGSQSVNYANYSGYTSGYSTSVELSGRIWFNGSGNHNVSMYESYGIVMNCVSHPWHVQVLNGSLLVGISASGANYGTGHLYTNGFIRPSGDYGLYSQDYGGYFRRNTYSYGTWESTGYAKNGWGGYVNNNNYIVSWMLNTSGDFGFLTENGNWWNLFYNNGNNCWGIGTDNTYSGDGFRCIKYGSAQYGWTTWSDRRAKENISTITGALDKVLNMRGVYFNYIIDEAKNKRVGFIAQELQQALPEAVRYAEEIDEYNVEYGQIVSVLAEAVKEHYAKTVAQQIEIDALKTQLQTLLN